MRRGHRRVAVRFARSVLGDDRVDRVLAMPFADEGFGYDAFGQERETGLIAYALTRGLYSRYFRVESQGHEHVPASGRVILAGNHSGLLPFDGMMLAIDLLERCDPPRAMRAIAERMLADLPYLSVLVARCGQVIGHRRNFEKLLEAEELVAVFPEGADGITKPFRERYRLRPFRVGFLEIALAHRAPLVPFAFVGAEEQAPVLANLEPLARMLGAPYFPVTPTFPLLGPLGMLPLPVKYHLSYGEPVRYYEDHDPEDLERPGVARALADDFQARVQALIDEGLARRKGIFR